MKKLLLLFSVFLMSFYTQAANEISVSGALVGNGNYNNLRLAFAAINGGSQTGANIVITITASPAADNATAILNDKGWATLKIYPTTSSFLISGTVNGPLIDLNGADNVTIDGRLGGSGAPKNLTISNLSTGTAASTIRFINDAKTNRIQYCTIKGSSMNTAGGVIHFSTALSSGGVGNDDNSIIGNDITNESGNRPLNAIYSGGTDLKANSGIAISNNNIFNFLNMGTTTHTYGVNLAASTDAISVSNNSFYETADITAGASQNCVIIGVMAITTIEGYTISGNFIGGKEANCGGGAWTKTNSSNNFKGIDIRTSSTASTNLVQGNTIRNFSWTNTTATSWYGISFNSAGRGTVSDNIIGSDSGTGSITIAATNANVNHAGINFQSSGSFTVQGNRIGSMTVTGGHLNLIICMEFLKMEGPIISPLLKTLLVV